MDDEVSYDELMSRYLKLKKENIKLKKFFLEAMQIAWDGGDWEGCDIQEFAESVKLGKFEKYNPDKHKFCTDYPDDLVFTTTLDK